MLLRVYITLFFYFFISLTFGQKYQHIELKVQKYPSIKTPEKLAALIISDFTSDEHRAAALYIWLGQNIKYDVKEAEKVMKGKTLKPITGKSKADVEAKFKKMTDDRILKALKSKKGVCDHYSLIFNRVSDIMGLENVRVSGYSKTSVDAIGKMPLKPDHAWNKVKINNEWKFIDATWGAGYRDSDKGKFVSSFNYNYFLIDESKFSLNHIDEKLDKKEIAKQRTLFSKAPFYHGHYIGSDIVLNTPNAAKVSTKGAKTIEVKLQNFPENKSLTYFFQNANKSGRVLPVSRIEGISTFEIPCDFKLNDLTHLYIEKEPLISFNVTSR